MYPTCVSSKLCEFICPSVLESYIQNQKAPKVNHERLTDKQKVEGVLHAIDSLAGDKYLFLPLSDADGSHSKSKGNKSESVHCSEA